MVYYQPRARNLEMYILTTVIPPNKCLLYIFHCKAQQAIILYCNPIKTSYEKPYSPLTMYITLWYVLQAYLVLLRFALFCFADTGFLQIEDKTLPRPAKRL